MPEKTPFSQTVHGSLIILVAGSVIVFLLTQTHWWHRTDLISERTSTIAPVTDAVTDSTTAAIQNNVSRPPSTTATSNSDGKQATDTVTEEKRQMTQQSPQVAELHTSAGEIDVRFFPDVAPNHVKNFIDLAEKGFYNGTKFHRVMPGFMIQGGDPNTISGSPSTWGTGGSGKNIDAEFNSASMFLPEPPVPHVEGEPEMVFGSPPWIMNPGITRWNFVPL